MPARPRTDEGRAGLGVALVVLVAVAVLAAYLVWDGFGPLPDREGCEARVGDVTVALSTEQAENAATIAAVGVGRGLPARAVSIALATAFQESKLENLDHGDRDSLGLFQQRPSQGWGTPAQVRDPVYAANAFYDELVEVDDYRSMRITEAAQEVQRSAHPEAYEEHAEGARALASALTGYSPARFSCVVDDPAPASPAASALDDEGLTARAAVVRAEVRAAFGALPMGGFAPGGVSTGHAEGSAHYQGRAVDVFFRPVTAENRRRGWALAQYLVAHAARLHVDHVIFDARIWSAGRRSERRWRTYTPPARSGDRAVLEHRDHVHVDVAGS